MTEKTFVVNQYLTLKLEGERTNIYVVGKLFRHCKFLLIDVPVEKINSLDEFQSIDEVADKLDHSLEPLLEKKEFIYSIPPEVEFWGHCSNLQVWYENGYNTRLLYSNLAFPLLRALAIAGDPQAKRIYKEEVAERYNYGVESVRKVIQTKHYFREFSDEEFLSMIQDEGDREVIERLREEYPRFEEDERGGGPALKLNIDVRKGRVIRLDLRGVKMKEIPNYLEKLTKLEHLNISFNQLETVPEWFGNLQELKVLIMTDNQFTTLPEVVGELRNLEELNACGNQIESLPESIGKLTSLKILELYQNKLIEIPESIGNLTNLRRLDLHENDLITLPDSIGNLKNLKKLRLHKNKIKTLPISIGNLNSLGSISLESNQLEHLPESIKALKNLKGLFLGNNQLRHLPDSIGWLEGLESMSINDNPIYKLPILLYTLPKLREFNIDNTHLKKEQIERNYFANKFVSINYQKIKDDRKNK